MKVSIVTISYNQSAFLEQAIKSVLFQDYANLEYIIVDAGSTDGSREIIEKYRDVVSMVIYESDEGPADGLNKGFRQASGDIYAFLNSDDVLLPGAISKVVDIYERNNDIDVVSGDALLIDENNAPIRKLYSDKFSLLRYAYGASFIVQQSTFLRSSVFKKVGGFNALNPCAWDGELFVDIALSGGRFLVVRDVWSGFRSHPDSISFSGKLDGEFGKYKLRIFKKIMNREPKPFDILISSTFIVVKHLLNPRGFVHKLLFLLTHSVSELRDLAVTKINAK